MGQLRHEIVFHCATEHSSAARGAFADGQSFGASRALLHKDVVDGVSDFVFAVEHRQRPIHRRVLLIRHKIT